MSWPAADARGSDRAGRMSAECPGYFWWHQPGLFEGIREWNVRQGFTLHLVEPPQGIPLPSDHPWAPANITSIGRSLPLEGRVTRSVVFETSYEFTRIHTSSWPNASHEEVRSLLAEVYGNVSSPGSALPQDLWDALVANETRAGPPAHDPDPRPTYVMNARWTIPFDVQRIVRERPDSRLRGEPDQGWGLPMGGQIISHAIYQEDGWRLDLHAAYYPGGAWSSLDVFRTESQHANHEVANETARQIVEDHYGQRYEPRRTEFRPDPSCAAA